MKHHILLIAVIFSIFIGDIQVDGQDTVFYSGTTLSNVDYHHGQLRMVKGVHNIQVFRANREHPEWADDSGWTYNHGPNLVYWNNTFYIQYLSNPIGEHIQPGQVCILSSKDGYNWDKPVVAFPPYKIPDGTTKEGHEGVAKNLFSVLHQRMGFFVAKGGRLLTLGYYGICLDDKDSPNDGKGIGRVVREIFRDGSMGQIYFIRYNNAWNEKNTYYPFYKSSEDKGFINACDELLSNPLLTQQWNEEADRDDPLIPLKGEYKAFSYYHLDDGRVVGLWKYALTSISNDNGKTWEYLPVRAPGFVNRNAKIWGQKTTDGKFAVVYNPSQFRWPLGISTSEDGIEYTNLLLVNGEITTERYKGAHKNYGPQYVRGILEGNGAPPDHDLWLTYSMNKEDIWVSKVPIPVIDTQNEPVNDIFNEKKENHELDEWNIFSPLWAPVQIKKSEGEKWLSLSDWDPFDYSKATRIIRAKRKLWVEFTIKNLQNNTGLLHIEFQDGKGMPAIRLIMDDTGSFKIKDGYFLSKISDYSANEIFKVKVDIDLDRNYYEVFVNDKKVKRAICFAPVQSIERVMFRTGERRYHPDADSPKTSDKDVENAGEKAAKAEYLIKYLKVESTK